MGRPVRSYKYQNKEHGTNARQTVIFYNGGPTLVCILRKFCGDLEATVFRSAVTIGELRRGDSPYGSFVCGRIPAPTRTGRAVCGNRTLLESEFPLPYFLDEQLACMQSGSHFFAGVTAVSKLKMLVKGIGGVHSPLMQASLMT